MRYASGNQLSVLKKTYIFGLKPNCVIIKNAIILLQKDFFGVFSKTKNVHFLFISNRNTLTEPMLSFYGANVIRFKVFVISPLISLKRTAR